jgi:hypothetical protein
MHHSPAFEVFSLTVDRTAMIQLISLVNAGKKICRAFEIRQKFQILKSIL